MDTPKKSLGQHWLNDKMVLQAIVDCADVRADDAVLEIGPGPGTLTRELLARGARVTAVELDEALAQDLSKTVLEDSPLKGDLTVVQQDILQFDLTRLTPGYKVVANIPYYLTSHLIRVLCESANPPAIAALLVQKEVAERAAAGPGQLSLLAVLAQFYCEVSLGPVVPAKLFTPPPKVDSQVLVLDYRQQPLFADVDTKRFFHIVKAGFSQKRKTLANALQGGLQLSKPEANALCEAAGLKPITRAQNLTLEEWHRLYRVGRD